MIVEHLREIQEHHGYLPKDQLVSLASALDVPMHRLHEIISFFPHFRLKPPPSVEVHVCRDQACHLMGAPACLSQLRGIAVEFGDEQAVHVEGVSCLGQCDGAPAVLIELHKKGEPDQSQILHHGPTDDRAVRLRILIAAHLEGRHVPSDVPDRSPKPWRIDPYQVPAHVEQTRDPAQTEQQSRLPWPEPYAAAIGLAGALARATDRTARQAVGQGLIDELKIADLRGMGGAGRPAFSKWGEVRDESERVDTTYIICNADESEPSTFKDREILLRALHLVIEGMVLGALIVGARQGYIYLRHEYFDQKKAIESELERARSLGVVGPNVLGTGCSFELEVFESPGGYICGEQSALIEAIEEHRAEPRNRPPVIEANGLYNQPTLLNNVETFAWVPAIVLNGGRWYRDSGLIDSPWYVARRRPGDPPDLWPRGKGLRFFSICGDVERPGVFEIPTGLTLGELIAMAGGMRDGLPLLAFAPSGPSGGLIPAVLTPDDLPSGKRGAFPVGRATISILELPLDKAEFDALGLLLGSGLFVIGAALGVDPATRLLDVALNATMFFRNESCGKCVPCRLGSQKLVQIGERLAREPLEPPARAEAFELLRSLADTMEQTSICSLGTSAPKSLTSLFEHDWVRTDFRSGP